MQRTWYLAVLGATLLGTLTCIYSHQASAASIATNVPGVQSALASTHTRHYSPYDAGYLAGYNDCGNQFPPANLYDRGSRYRNGYTEGYNFCQSKRAEGSITGNAEGYNAGYQQCQRERSIPTISGAPSRSFGSFAPPIEQGHDPAFSAAFAQGYNACQQQYGTLSQPQYGTP
jgi:hypothetical protein